MLGDNSEKSKNPLKKAMRRRNTKNVAFAAPTYIEASDVEYSTEDEDDGGGFYIDDEDIAETDDIEERHDEDIIVEPLRPKSQREKEAQEPETVRESQETERQSPEPRQSAEEAMESEGNAYENLANRKEMLTRYWKVVPSAGPEMALCGTRIHSSRTTRPNRRRYH